MISVALIEVPYQLESLNTYNNSLFVSDECYLYTLNKKFSEVRKMGDFAYISYSNDGIWLVEADFDSAKSYFWDYFNNGVAVCDQNIGISDKVIELGNGALAFVE